jgi:hypothetical protein
VDGALAGRNSGYSNPIYNTTLPSVTLLLFGLIGISSIAAAETIAGEIAVSFMRRAPLVL